MTTVRSEELHARGNGEPVAALSRAWRRHLVPLVLFAVAVFAFMPASLTGQRTKLAVDILEKSAPYRDAIRRKPHVVNVLQGDAVDFQPLAIQFFRSLRSGKWQNWDHTSLAGTPLGTLPFEGIVSPTSIGFLFLPAWLAVTVKLALLLLICELFMYLLMMRLGTARPAAALAAVAYTFTGTNMVLAQRVNEVFLLPGLFWAAHRLDERPTFKRAAVFALMIAWSWFEGFPAGFAYSVLMTGAWAAWLIGRRVARQGFRSPSVARGTAERAAAFCAALALGAAISAIQLIPFAHEVLTRGTLTTRRYGSRDHLPPNFYFGLFDLSVIGRLTNPAKWWTAISLGYNPVETVTFIGSVVASGAALALGRSALGRLRLAGTGRDAWPFLCGFMVILIVLNFEGTVLLSLFYEIPGIGGNPFTRSRFGIAFAAVAIAALGVDDWWRRRVEADPGTERAPRTVAILSSGVIVGLAIKYAHGFYSAASRAGERSNIAKSVALSVVIGALAIALALALRAARDAATQTLLLSALAALLFVQLAIPFHNFIAEAPRSDFYTTHSGHRTVKELTGKDYRFAANENNFNTRSNMIIGWNDLRGGGLWSNPMKRLIRIANPTAFDRDAFRIILTRDEWNLRSPVYDQLAVRYFGLGTDETPYGLVEPEPPSTEPRKTPGSAEKLEFDVAAPKNVAGVGLRLRTSGSACASARLKVVLHTPRGRGLASAKTAIDSGRDGWSFFALAGDRNAQPEFTRLTVAATHHCVVLAGRDPTTGSPVVRWIVEDPRAPLRVVSTDQAWIYERPNAWKIVTAHSSWRAFENRQSLLRALAELPPGPSETAFFVGHAPKRPTLGTPAAIRRVSWKNNGIAIKTSGSATSLIVVSQDLPDGWSATVDGRSTRLVKVNGTLAGVFVDPGGHTVRLTYRPKSFVIGAIITGIALALSLALCALELAKRLRGRRGGGWRRLHAGWLTPPDSRAGSWRSPGPR